MALTNAEKQARHRQRQQARIAELEAQPRHTIVCDAEYLATLARRLQEACKLSSEATTRMEAEIEALEQGDPWYSMPVIATAFNISLEMLHNRTDGKHKAFQGNLPTVPLSAGAYPLHYGTWMDACAVNKDARSYRTWVDPNDAIKALAISHRIHRLEAQAQLLIDETPPSARVGQPITN